MRILFLGPYKSAEFYARYRDANDSEFGGQRKITLLLRALLKAGHEIKVVSSAVGCRSRWASQMVPAHTERFPEGDVAIQHASTIQLKPWGGFLVGFTATWRAAKLASDWRPEVVIAYNGRLPEAGAMLACRAWLGLPFVLEVDDLPGVRGNPKHPKAVLERAVWPWVVREAAAFVFVNSQMRDKILTESRPIYFLPGVIDDDLISRAQARRPPFSDVQRRLLYAGGLSRDRGAGDLLSAIPLLPDGWQASVAGAGALGTEFEKLAKRMPHKCRYLGLLSAHVLYEELCGADVVVNTREKLNDSAGVFPFKLLEYLSCGAHVITTPLPRTDAMDLRWAQRWSGRPEDLPMLLESAEADWRREASLREACAKWIAVNYSLAAIGISLTELLSRCVKTG